MMTVEAAFDNNELWQRQLKSYCSSQGSRVIPGKYESKPKTLSMCCLLLISLAFLKTQLLPSSFLSRKYILTVRRGSSHRHLKCSYFPLMYIEYHSQKFIFPWSNNAAQRWMISNIANAIPVLVKYSSQNVNQMSILVLLWSEKS